MTDRATDNVRLVYLPWFPRDFYASTRGWPLIARGIYRELLDLQFEQKSIDFSPENLRKAIGASRKEWQIAWPLIEPKFPQGADGRRRNRRLDQHLTTSLEKAEKSKARATTAARARWSGHASGRPQ
jgi:uncharacterized protein YdaU (DUF1376 family)